MRPVFFTEKATEGHRDESVGEGLEAKTPAEKAPGLDAAAAARVGKVESFTKKVGPDAFKNLTQQKVPEQKESDQLLDKMRQELEVFKPGAKIREPVRDKEGNVVMDKNTNKPQMRERDVHGGDKALTILKIIFLAVAYLQAMGKEISGETKLPLPREKEEKPPLGGAEGKPEKPGAKTPEQFDRERQEVRTHIGKIDEEIQAERDAKSVLEKMVPYIKRWAEAPRYTNPQTNQERAVNARIDKAKERLQRIQKVMSDIDEYIVDLQRQRGELQRKLDKLDQQSGPLEARIRVLNMALQQVLDQIPGAKQGIGGFEFAVTEQGIIVVRLKDPQGFLHAFFEDHFSGKTEVSFDELRRALEGVNEGKTNQKPRENKSPEGPRPSPDVGEVSPEAKEQPNHARRKSKGLEILRHAHVSEEYRFGQIFEVGDGQFKLEVRNRLFKTYYDFRFDAERGQWEWKYENGSYYPTTYYPQNSTDEYVQEGVMSARAVIDRLHWVNTKAENTSAEELALHDNREHDGETHIKRWGVGLFKIRKVGTEWELDTAGTTEYFFRYNDVLSAWEWRYEDDTTYHPCSKIPADKWANDPSLQTNEVPVPASYSQGLNNSGMTQARYIISGLQSVSETKQDMYTWRANSMGEPFKTVKS